MAEQGHPSSRHGATNGAAAFLAEAGEMGGLIRDYDWSGTLGTIDVWPQSLKTATALLLRSPVPIVMLWGADGIMIYNDAYSGFAGGRHPQLLGSKVREGWPEVADFNDHVMKVGLAGGTLAYKDQELTLHRHGRPEQVWMNLDYSPVLDESGRPAGVIAIVIETTERVVADRLRQETEQRFRAMADSLPSPAWVTGPDGVEFVNQAFLDFTGLPEEELLREGWTRLLDPRDLAKLLELRDQARTEARSYSLVVRARRADGAWRTVQISVSPKVVIDGSRPGYVGVATDLTDLATTQDALRHSEERLRAIFDTTPECIKIVAPDETLVDLNEAGLRQFQVDSPAEIVGTPLPELIAPEDHVHWRHHHHRVCAGETLSWEFDVIGRKGRRRRLETHAVPMPLRDGRVAHLGVTRDVTAQRAAEAALSRSEAALREEGQMLETLNGTAARVSAELDLASVVQMVIDAGVELTGAQFGAFFYNVVDGAGESYMLYGLSGARRDQFDFGMPRITAVFHTTFSGEGVVRSDDITKDARYGLSDPHFGMPKGHLPVVSYLAVPVISRSGEVIGGLLFGHPEPARFTARHEQLMLGVAGQAAIAMDNARLYEAAQRELASREAAEQELRLLNETLEQRVADEIGRRAEAEEALRQAQKMETLGQLTGGVAHDFNNLLQVVLGNIELIQRGLPEDSARLKRAVDNAARGAERAAVLTQRLLAFSRRQPLAPKPIEPNRLVAGMSELLHRTLGETVAVETVLASGLWMVEADPHQLENAILNLAINGRDAMAATGNGGGGKLTIETCNVHLDRAYAAQHREVPPGQYVCISVSDTGCGMDADTAGRAFEPFFTTKDVGKGTGLGLSMVYGFVKQSGGHLKIYSEVAEGTTVKIYLPRLQGARVAIDEAVEPLVPEAGQNETVLVCEDDDDVRAFTVEVLRELGYRVLEAGDGPSALRLLAKDDGRVDLIFTDVVLPGGMTGAVLAREARAIRPDVKVLFTTGYARNAIVHHGRLDPGVELITKPFSSTDLAARVRDMLDGAG